MAGGPAFLSIAWLVVESQFSSSETFHLHFIDYTYEVFYFPGYNFTEEIHM
jgi:hypothetical protein